MQEAFRQSARETLDYLRRQVDSELLTCHFFNQRSQLYWLFCKCGTFNFDEISHGPLTHFKQFERFRHNPPGVDDDKSQPQQIVLFPVMPPELSQGILNGESFVKREQVKSAIRLRLKGDVAIPLWGAAYVYIFLNYRSPQSNAVLEKHAQTIQAASELINKSLMPLLQEPRLNSESAWIFRSHSLRFWQELAQHRPSPLPTDARQQTQELYDDIVKIANDLVRPRGGTVNRLCTLSLLRPDNEVELVASAPSEVKDLNGKIGGTRGIVWHVAHSGQTFLISNVAEYKLRRDADKPSPSRPEYVACDEKTRCELAIPLMVQGHLVGVLNIEAEEEDAYDDEAVLLASQLAAATALAVRQTILWQELKVAAQHQTELIRARDPVEVFRGTAAAAEKWDNPAIWDNDAHAWYGKEGKLEREAPRREGYTRWILDNEMPIAIADLRRDTGSPGKVLFSCYKGRPRDGTREIHKWEELRAPYDEVSDTIKRLVLEDDRRPIITDFGFPIFSTDPNGKVRVRAVLWAKGVRYFASVTDDEAWCLSTLCEHATQVLEVVRKSGSEEHQQQLATEILVHHFGEKKVAAIAQDVQRDPNFLTARRHDELIVLNADIRGSTGLGGAMAATTRMASQYVDFIQQYHKEAQAIILASDGIFDKTMGDGVQGLFLARPVAPQSDIRPFPDAILCPTLKIAAMNAVKCVFEMFQFFWDHAGKLRSRIPFKPPDPLAMGIALTTGRAFVGSLSAIPATLEFSAYGAPANRAGKYVGVARVEDIENALERPSTKEDDQFCIMHIPGETRDLTDGEKDRLLRYLKQGNSDWRTRSILLSDADFADLVFDATQKPYTLIRLPSHLDVKRELPFLIVPTKDLT